MKTNGIKKFLQIAGFDGQKTVIDATVEDKGGVQSSTVVPISAVPDSEPKKSLMIETVPYGSDVDSRGLLRLVFDLVGNDGFLDEQYRAMMDVLGDGVFDLPGMRFELESWSSSGSTVTITFGPGKLKYVDEAYSQQAVWTSNLQTVLSVDLGSLTPGMYRRDLVSVVYRTSDVGETGLAYGHGDRWGSVPQVAHTFADAKSTQGYGSQPLWSLLWYVESDGSLSLKDATIVQPSVGLANVATADRTYMHKVVDYVPGYTLFRLHPTKSVRLCDGSGAPLTIDYGNAKTPFLNETRIAHEGTGFVGDQLPMEPKTPSASGSERVLVPFMVSQDSFEAHFESFFLKKFSVGMRSFATTDDTLGIEAHIITYPRLVRGDFVDRLQVAEKRVPAQMPGAAMTANEIAIRVSGVDPSTTFPMTTYDGRTYSEASAGRKPKAGDFVMFAPVTGAQYPRTVHPVRKTYVETADSSLWLVIEMPEAASLAGAYCHVFAGDVQNVAPASARTLAPTDVSSYPYVGSYQSQAYFSKFPRNVTNCSVIPYDDGNQLNPRLKGVFANANPDLVFEGMTGWRWIDMPFDIELSYGQWYFVSLGVMRKTGSNPTYEVVPEIAKATSPCPEYGHRGGYMTQPGRFPTEETFALYDDFGLVSDEELARPTAETKFMPYGALLYAVDEFAPSQLPADDGVLIDVTQGMALFKNGSCPDSLYMKGSFINVVNADITTNEVVHVDVDGTRKLLSSELERIEALVNLVNNYKVVRRDNVNPINGAVYGSNELHWTSYVGNVDKGAFFKNVLSDSGLATAKALNFLVDRSGKKLEEERIYGVKCARLLPELCEGNTYGMDTDGGFVLEDTETVFEVGKFDENARHFEFANATAKPLHVKRLSLRLLLGAQKQLGSGWNSLSLTIHDYMNSQRAQASMTYAAVSAIYYNPNVGTSFSQWLHFAVDFVVNPGETLHLHVSVDSVTTPLRLAAYDTPALRGYGYRGDPASIGASYMADDTMAFWDGNLVKVAPPAFSDTVNPANNVPWAEQYVNFAYADLGTNEKWTRWKYFSFVGIDSNTGRVKWPLPTSRPVYASYSAKLSALNVGAGDIPVDNRPEYRKYALKTEPVAVVNDLLPIVDKIGAFAAENGSFNRVLAKNGQKVVGIFESSAGVGRPSTSVPGQTLDPESKFLVGRVFNAVYNDVAEHMPSDGSCEPGDLMQVDDSHPTFRVTKYRGDAALIAGVYSAEPGFCVGYNEGYDDGVWCALKGMVWINASELGVDYAAAGDVIMANYDDGKVVAIPHKKWRMYAQYGHKVGVVIAVGVGKVKVLI